MSITEPTPRLISAPTLFIALVNDVRWSMVVALAHSDYHRTELARFLNITPEQVAAQMEPIEALGLISQRPSDANPSETYYHLDLDRLRDLYRQIGATLHPALLAETEAERQPAPPPAHPRVLFLCTHNSARSQMAEGLLRRISRGAIDAFSAGNQPAQIHPDAVEVMAGIGIDISQQQSKHLDQFIDQPFDYIVTVCDNARENCPTFPGNYRRIHWSIPDPAAVIESPDARYRAFQQTVTHLQTMVRYLVITIERERRSR